MPAGLTVLVVDDSAVVRQVLTRELLRHKAIDAVHSAPSGSLALRKIAMFNPDVVTLDVEMPEMDGLETLEKLMASYPRPVIMVSAATHAGANKTMLALDLGAVDFIAKPVGRMSDAMEKICGELSEKIVAISSSRSSPDRIRARSSRTHTRMSIAAKSRAGRVSSRRSRSSQPPRSVKPANPPDIIAIGASTGGTVAIRTVLGSLARDLPVGVLIVQHMPEAFTQSFAERLNELCPLEVKEAAARDMIRPGRALVAPGHSHMRVRRGDFGCYVDLDRDPPVSGHRPSVDVLFESVVETYRGRAIGVLLTGMGRDGADGLATLHHNNALTIAQDAESCVVFGMPRVAIEAGCAAVVTNLSEIGPLLAASCQRNLFVNDEHRSHP